VLLDTSSLRDPAQVLVMPIQSSVLSNCCWSGHKRGRVSARVKQKRTNSNIMQEIAWVIDDQDFGGHTSLPDTFRLILIICAHS